MDEKQILDEIVMALHENGYSPYDQLVGYIEIGNENYITNEMVQEKKIR